MRKLLTLLSVLMLFSTIASAQTRTITGTVTDEKGDPVPFVTINIKGKRVGTSADASGNFEIKAVAGDVLVVSGTDLNGAEVTVGADNKVGIRVTRKNTALTEVVVTALGIRRKPKELGYASASVNAQQITAGKSFNLAQSLSGKVSGLTISNTSASVNASPRVVLRGLRSIGGDNTALIVLDGVAVPSNTINYINPNDVERVDVMKGGQAATLFGSEGVNGAIIITTKKGSQRPEISFTHSSNVEKLAYLPKTQHGFGSGSAYGSSREENFHPAENQQYGAPYDGLSRRAGRQLVDGSQPEYAYSDISDVREKFWATGYTAQSDLSYRAGDQNSNFFASYQNLASNGIVPGDKYNRNSLRMNAGRTYGKVNLSFDATYTWDKADRTNTDFYFFALNTASWIPTNDLKDWRTNKFADPSGYFNDYYNNPWWLLDNNRFTTKNNFFNGNVKLVFKATSFLDITARIAIANTNTNQTTTANSYTYTGYARSNAFINGYNNNYDRFLTGAGRAVARTPIAGSIGETQNNGNRLNGDLFASFTKDLGENFSLKAIAGASVQVRTSKGIGVSTSGIGTPDLFNLTNSSTGLYAGSNSITEQRKIGGYGDVTLGYKGFLYLHGVYRNDYTSVFYNESIGFDNPSFSTYGGDISFVVSELLPGLKNAKIDNLKLRASYNQNGNDNLSAYQLQTTFPNASGYPYSGLVGTTRGNTTVAPNLVPELVKTAEVGMEIGFLGKFSLEASYYHQKSEKQILSVGISSSTAYTDYLINAADVTNTGFELDGRANVYRSKDWNINVTANYTHSTNVVNDLYGATGLNSIPYQTPDALVTLNAEKGQMFPYLKTTVLERDPQGRVIIDPTDGWPLRATARAGQGTTLPTDILGVGLNVAYKGLTLIANAEYRGGNVIYHDIGTDMSFTGSGALTTLYNRDVFVWPNSVYDDGTGKFVPNTNIAVDAYKAMYQGFGDLGFSRGFNGVGEFYVSSGAFWKLRDLSLSYDLPKSVMNHVKALKGISITAWARNLVTILPDDNWFTDPEFSNTSGNSTGLNTTLNTPPTRQIGGTIKIVF
jgi:TonB-linked SusC/RagA family outer membrane protein